MTEPTNKTELRNEIERAHQDLVRVLASMGDEEKVAPLLQDGWSVKDSLAHLVAWEKMTMDWLARSLQGEDVKRFIPGYIYETPAEQEPVMQALNTHLFEQNRSRALDEVMRDFRAAHRAILDFVSKMDERDIFDPNRFAWRQGSPAFDLIAGNTFEHYAEHQGWILEWRARGPDYPKTRAELLERIHTRHADMAQFLRQLTPAQLTAPELDGGWSVKDSLAHIAAWESMLFDEVDKYRRGEPVVLWAPGFEIAGDNGEAQMHRYNEYLFQQNKDRPLEEVLDDFRSTYLRVVETVEGLSPDELFNADHFPARAGRPLITLIVGDTYGHYDEHLTWIRAWLDKSA